MRHEGEIINFPSEETDPNKEISQKENEHLASEIEALFPDKGDNSRDYELLKIALRGSQDEKRNISFDIGQRGAELWHKADSEGLDDFEKGVCGAKMLLLRAASYLDNAPSYAQECVDLARLVLGEEIVWEDVKVPDADKEMIQERIAEEQSARKAFEESQRRKAA